MLLVNDPPPVVFESTLPPPPPTDSLLPFGSPLELTTAMPSPPNHQHHNRHVEENITTSPPHNDNADNDEDDDNEVSTPSSGRLPDNPLTMVVPSAPSKRNSHTSVTSRFLSSSGTTASTATAARSLTPLFNGFVAAADRASQLGGRFVQLRPQASAIARMQGQLSLSVGTLRGDKATTAQTVDPVAAVSQPPQPQPQSHTTTTSGLMHRRAVSQPITIAAAGAKRNNGTGNGIGSGGSGGRFVAKKRAREMSSGAAPSVRTVSRGREIKSPWQVHPSTTQRFR